MSTVNEVIKAALDFAFEENPNVFFNSSNRATLESKLQASFNAILPKNLTLASDKPDFEAILLTLVQELQNDTVWKDIVHTGTGQTILRNITAGISYLHFGIVKSTQNAFVLEGASKNSIYQAMNSQGVKIRRRVPKRVKARITIADHANPVIIPRLTQFTIAGVDYFNRDQIAYTEFDIEKELILYQGTLYTNEGTLAGIPYETIEIGYENFSISNEDVYVTINDEIWSTTTTLKPWMLTDSQKIFFTKTLETGNVQVRFGNGVYGKKPASESIINITWAETLGLDSNQIQTDTGFSINNLEIAATGMTISSSYGGDNELDPEFYAIVGPHIRSSNGFGVNRPSFRALALEYPGIKDALFRGQAEIAPNKKNRTNDVEVTLLTYDGMPLTDDEYEEFIEFIKARSISQLNFIRRDPFIIPIVLRAEVYCVAKSDLEEIKTILINKITELFKPRQGAIGYSIFNSDIISVLEGKFPSINGVDYSKLIEFSKNLIFSYAPNFEISTLPAGVGLEEDADGIIANYIAFIRIENVTLDVKYTPRRTYTGRNDISINPYSS